MSDDSRVVLLTGGLGGARLAPALRNVLRDGRLAVIANVGDDLDWHGIRVCPDLDSVTYSLAGLWDSERGWGLRDETFGVRDALLELGASAWFNVGDKDLALHIMRADALRERRTLTEAMRELAPRLGATGVDVLPASDEKCETHMLPSSGRLLHFQEWYVGKRAHPELREVRLAEGRASEAAISALERADVVVLGPSNPVTSIGAILNLEGMREAVMKVPIRIAVSPIVVGIGSEDPGVLHHSLARKRILDTIGCADEPGDISARYSGLVEHFLVDHTDAEYEDQIRENDLNPVRADLLDAHALANALVDLI